MDALAQNTADLSPLEQRREALRAFSDEVMAAIRTLPMPQTWQEGERAMRCLATSDRVVVQLFSKAKAPAQAARASTPSDRPQTSRTEPRFVYDFDDEEVTGDSDAGQVLDAVLDELEALCDAPLPTKPAKPSARDQGYLDLAEALARGRDLLRDPGVTRPLPP